MPFSTITKGLTIKVPTRKTKDWDSTLVTELFDKISEHTHQGSGTGNQIATNAIASNAVDDTKIRLRNGQWLRSRNAANTGDIDLIRANGSDTVEVPVTLSATAGTIYTNEPGAAPTIAVGETYFQPNYIFGSALTLTIVSGAFMHILGFIQVDGTLIVEGELRVA
jgi:hypothetical protein